VKILIEFDVSVFYLQYSDSVGKATISNPVSTYTGFIPLDNNGGSNTSKGFEEYVKFNPVEASLKHKR
jgi:hypothetical protein